MLASILLSVIALTSNPLQARLPPGPNGPTAGATCHGSPAALGTSNTETASGTADTVVNIWQVVRASSGEGLGWIMRTHDGRLWYQDPVPYQYQFIAPDNVGLFLGPTVKYVACFQRDLKVP